MLKVAADEKCLHELNRSSQHTCSLQGISYALFGLPVQWIIFRGPLKLIMSSACRIRLTGNFPQSATVIFGNRTPDAGRRTQS